jgi:TPP-dependent pyruvate/acetoin dehydrogenase alpha subunit
MTPGQLQSFEREVATAFNAGKVRAPVHLSGGNEAKLIRYFEKCVKPGDWVATTWRSHYHCLLHGVPRDRLMQDILAGKSIALNYPEHRVVASAIVGGALPIALGIAAGIKRRGGKEKVHAFCGDMAGNGGTFHECLEYAWGHELPITFVVERNGLSVCTDTNIAWGMGGEKHPPRVVYSYHLPWPHSGAGKRVEF